MDSSEEPRQDRQIQLGLSSIVENADKWLQRLGRREFRFRLASSFLVTILVFCAIGVSFLLYFQSQGQLNNFLQNQTQDNLVIGISGLPGLVCGFSAYFLLKRKHDKELRELSSVVSKMKRISKEEENAGGSEVIAESALSMADRLMTLLPGLAKKRSLDSILFGIITFIIVDIFVKNVAVSILAGVIVSLYSWYETKKTYDQEMVKLEEQKRVYEKRKKEFMESL